MADEKVSRKLGRVGKDPLDKSKRNMKSLPWREEMEPAYEAYKAEQPSQEEIEKVRDYAIAPIEIFKNPHLRVKSVELELAHLYRAAIGAIIDLLDEDTACKVAYEFGKRHGARRLSTFYKGHNLSGGVEAMAMWQDYAHATVGPMHTSALFADYDHEMVEVSRTENSFGSAVGVTSPVEVAFASGFSQGYKSVDPSLSYIEELIFDRPDGTVEYVHRFWFNQD